MQHLRHIAALFAIFLFISSDNIVGARRHNRRQSPCTVSSAPGSPSASTTPQPPPVSTPASTSPISSSVPTSAPSSPGPPNPPVCNMQSPGICQLATKSNFAGNPLVQDAWIFNPSCNVIGGTTGLALYQTHFLASQLPYGIVLTGNSPTASPSFDYAGGHYGVGGTDGGIPGWWCAIEADGTYDCYALFKC
ncbi:65c6c771-2719-4440-b65b-53cd3a8b7151 [Sclerotinia trifoliorum]|uniref:65c6c771-2719-4440-b65b-53cd3a8b7151 n=1 Tax=Sclerotinia trifoliorum TaxID=28548 RepID=A0A8H2VXW6_9HELO|nr:65c6c771-2719-4440-b65b-53cd3a8b7151 [Sclerotinia trifoliorum]